MDKLKIITTVLGIFVCLTANSQSNKTTFSIEIGANYSSSSEETAPLKKTTPILPRVGVAVDYKISETFFLESGLIYAIKGLKSKGGGEKNGMAIYAKIDLKQHLLQLPILIGKKINIKNHQISFLTGVYTSYGISGITKVNSVIDGINVNKNVHTFGNNSLLNRFDGGVVFKANYLLINNISISLSYELGLIDIGNQNVVGEELHYKNRCLVLTMKYRF